MKIPPFDQITFSRYLQRIKPRKVRCKIPINYNEEKIKILTLIFSCYKLAILVKLICKCYINVIFIFRTCNNRRTSGKNAAAGNYLGKVIYQSGGDLIRIQQPQSYFLPKETIPDLSLLMCFLAKARGVITRSKLPSSVFSI